MSKSSDWKRSEESLPYFVEHFLEINTPHDGWIPFKLRPYQRNVLMRLQGRDYYIISKARQVGISNMLLALCLWECYFNSGIEILWMSSNGDMTNHASRKFTDLQYTCKLTSNIHIRSDQKRKKEFSNGSIIRFRPADRVIEPATRYDLMVIDEGAYIDKMDDIVTEIPFIMKAEPKVIVASTPSSSNDWFDKTFMRALRGQNRFIPMQLDWTVRDDWDKNWRKEQNKMFGSKEASIQCDGTVKERFDIR